MNELDVAFYSTSFCHGVLSLINIAAVSDCVNRDRIALDREQDAPVTRPQPHARRSLERLHVADPGSANVFNLRSICARVVAVSLRHWRIAAEVNSISFTSHVSHNAMLKSKQFRIVRYWIAAPWIQLPAWHALTGRGRHAGFGWYARFRNGLCDRGMIQAPRLPHFRSLDSDDQRTPDPAHRGHRPVHGEHGLDSDCDLAAGDRG